MTQEGVGVAEAVENLKERVKKNESDIEMFKKQYRDLQERINEMGFSKNKEFETAKKYIEQKRFVSLTELRFKFPSLTNVGTLSKFNQKYDSSIAIFMIYGRGKPRFYVHCNSNVDTLYDFARLWNRTLGIGQKDITIYEIKSICLCDDKKMGVIKEFIEVFFSNFAYFDSNKLIRK